MSAEYIDIDGRRVRIEFNWNTTIEFLDNCGISLDEFIGLSSGNKITPRHIRQLAWSGAIEGERIEGRELGMGEIEFGSKLYPPQIAKVMEVFASQFSGIVAEKKKKGRTPMFHLRIFR